MSFETIPATQISLNVVVRPISYPELDSTRV